MLFDRARLVAELHRLREELQPDRRPIADRIGQILARLEPTPTTLDPRMALPDTLRLVADLIARAHVRATLVGGLATLSRSPSNRRLTGDVDFLLPEPDRSANLTHALEQSGFVQVRGPTVLFHDVRLLGTWAGPDGIEVDLLWHPLADTIDGAAELDTLAGVPLRKAKAEHLAFLKLLRRLDVDESDVALLLRDNPETDLRWLRGALARYGLEGDLDAIVARVRGDVVRELTRLRDQLRTAGDPDRAARVERLIEDLDA
jgi:hypothetical protein